MQRLIFLPIILVMVLLTSCTDDDTITELPDIATSTIEMFRGEWQLENITLNSGDVEIPPVLVSLTLVPDAIEPRGFEYQGTATCNDYTGNLFLFSEEVLLVSDLLSTEILCETEILNTFESRYYATIEQTNVYRVDQETLVLSARDGTVLNFLRIN